LFQVKFFKKIDLLSVFDILFYIPRIRFETAQSNKKHEKTSRFR